MPTGSPGTWVPAGDLTIYTVAALSEAMHEALNRHPVLEIDMAGIGELDTAGIQLLLMGQREARANRGSLRLSGASAEARALFALLGLSETFGLALEGGQA